MSLEIERKFLVLQPPEQLEQYAGNAINQGYVCIGDDGSEVRIRDNNGQYTQTVKSSGDLVRGEWEIPLTLEQFMELWPTTEGRRIEKTRYKIPHEQYTIEFDVFAGKLGGLMLAEVEFADEASAVVFAKPDWFGEDVTSDKQYKNQNLALR